MAKTEKKPAKAPKKTASKAYDASAITVLEGLDPVRKRPGMYIGNTGEGGLHHLIWEVVDNSIDEAMAGHADKIIISLLPEGKVEVSDNGRGIPVEKHKVTKKSALETVLTTLHAGGKFGGDGYKVSGGLHGVGVSVVNALSSYVKAEVRRDKKTYVQEYNKGVPLKDVKAVGTSTQDGTTITFVPDTDIFSVTEFKWQTIVNRIRQQAYLTKGIYLELNDQRENHPHQSYAFFFQGGISSYVRHLNRDETIQHEEIFYVDKEQDDVKVEISLQYTDNLQENTYGFANNILTPGGGTHIIGFSKALTRVLNKYASKKNLLKEKDGTLTGDDTKEGLTSVISVKIQEPQFEGQTKDKLGNPEVKGIVENIFAISFGDWLEEHPKDAEKMIGKCLLAAQARRAAKAARESVLRKGAMDNFNLPGKLADCSSKKMEECELFIVEGDSAGGSAKQARDRKFQAILPLRGKLLNVERARLDRVIKSETILPMIIALGTNIGEMFNKEKLRYSRIILMADADVDGSHIRTLLLTFFFRHFRSLVDEGHLYIAQPPLFKISKGKAIHYAYTDEDKEKIMAQMMKDIDAKTKAKLKAALAASGEQEGQDEDGNEVAKPERNIAGIGIQRYKGLGEMNPEQLWETTLDPERRIIKQVTIDDAELADETFRTLMGSEVAPRRRFIQTNAENVTNLDV
jgi:DNA gyrase subunit B